MMPFRMAGDVPAVQLTLIGVFHFPSFPNSVWERTCLRNSVSLLGNRVAGTLSVSCAFSAGRPKDFVAPGALLQAGIEAAPLWLLGTFRRFRGANGAMSPQAWATARAV